MSADGVILSFRDAALRPGDINHKTEYAEPVVPLAPSADGQTLREGEWVNDAVINFVYEIIASRATEVSLWPPSVTELLCTLPNEQSGTEGLLPSVKPSMALPVSDRFGDPKSTSSHWSCLICQGDEAAHFDSMAPANTPASELVFEKLRELTSSQVRLLAQSTLPQQANASDCGLYAILLPFAHFTDVNSRNVHDTAASLTPKRVAAFRQSLLEWLESWSMRSEEEQHSIKSWDQIIRMIGPLRFDP